MSKKLIGDWGDGKCATCQMPIRPGDRVVNQGAVGHEDCLKTHMMTREEVADVHKAMGFDDPDYEGMWVGPTPGCSRCVSNPAPLTGRCVYCELEASKASDTVARRMEKTAKSRRKTADNLVAQKKRNAEIVAANAMAASAQMKAQQASVMQRLMKESGTEEFKKQPKKSQAIAKPTSFTLWGKRLTVGCALEAAEVGALRIIADNPATDPDIQRLVRQIIKGVPSSETALQPVEEPPLPPELADEMTMRAREALIATGDFPGADYEHAIRSGLMDSLSGVRASIQVQRDMGTPVETLRERKPRQEKALIEVAQHLPQPLGAWGRFGRWLEHIQHRFVKLWSHYESAKARNLVLAGQIVSERSAHNKQMALLEGEVSKTKEEAREEADNLKREAAAEASTLKAHITKVEEELRQARVEIGKFRLGVKKANANGEIAGRSAIPYGKSGVRAAKSMDGTRWVASDGKSFDNKADAVAHANMLTRIGNADTERLETFLATARPEERSALLELAKHALAARRIDPHTDQIVLSMVVKKFDASGVPGARGRAQRTVPSTGYTPDAVASANDILKRMKTQSVKK